MDAGSQRAYAIPVEEESRALGETGHCRIDHVDIGDSRVLLQILLHGARSGSIGWLQMKRAGCRPSSTHPELHDFSVLKLVLSSPSELGQVADERLIRQVLPLDGRARAQEG